jgi:hypothetical protein
VSVIVAAIQAGGSSSGLSDTVHVHVHVHGSDPSTSSLFGLTARLTSGLIPPRDQLAKRASASFQSSRLQLRTAGIRLSLCSAKTSALRSLPAASSQHSQRKRVPHRSAPVRPVVAHHTCFLCARGLRSTQFSASSFQLTGRRSSCWISLQRPSSPPLPWPLDRASCFKQYRSTALLRVSYLSIFCCRECHHPDAPRTAGGDPRAQVLAQLGRPG